MRGIRISKKWKDAEEARISAMSNETLLEETLDAQMGDDYDGGFTKRGFATMDLMLEELRERLRGCGFLSSK